MCVHDKGAVTSHGYTRAGDISLLCTTDTGGQEAKGGLELYCRRNSSRVSEY